jgi:hypothetical protein
LATGTEAIRFMLLQLLPPPPPPPPPPQQQQQQQNNNNNNNNNNKWLHSGRPTCHFNMSVSLLTTACN